MFHFDPLTKKMLHIGPLRIVLLHKKVLTVKNYEKTLTLATWHDRQALDNKLSQHMNWKMSFWRGFVFGG